MRLNLITVVAVATLASSVSAITHCTLESLQDAASHELCGDRVEVSRCLSVLEEVDRLAFLKECLLAGGCSEEEAVASVQRVADSCSKFQDDEFSEDLKRRANDKDSTTTTTTTTDKAGKTTAVPKTTEPTTTTSKTSTTSTTSQSTVTSTSSTSSTSDSTTTSSTITTTDTTTGTQLQCLTTSQQTITWCVTTTADGGAVNSACIPTTSPVIGCAPGLICQTQAAGDTTCMQRQDSLTTSGWVVTIIFGLVAVIFLTTCCTMCIKTRQRSQRKSNKAKAVTVTGGNTRGVEATKLNTQSQTTPGGNPDAEASDSHLPLLAAQAPIASSNSSMRDAPTDYSTGRPTAHRVPSSSYQDVVASRKPAGALPVYPGPPDLGPDYSDMGNGRSRQGR